MVDNQNVKKSYKKFWITVVAQLVKAFHLVLKKESDARKFKPEAEFHPAGNPPRQSQN